MSTRPLEGFRILDLTRVVAGPFATAILADLGAEVIKVERPRTGDDYRYGPSKQGELSLSFQNNNRGKHSITLDVRTEQGRELLLRLVEDADAVVENFRAGWMARQGLGPEVIQARNPRCVVASLSGYGQTGPAAGRASYDIVAQAASGFMSMTGFPDGPPVRGGGALGDFVGGLYLAVGLVTALLERERSGRARVLDLSNQDAMFAVTDSALTIHEGIGAETERLGNQHPFTSPYDCYATKDGHVVLASASNRLFRKLCEGIGRPELAEDPRFADFAARYENRDALMAELDAAFARKSSGQWMSHFAGKIPIAPVLGLSEALENPYFHERGGAQAVAHPERAELKMVASPIRLDGELPPARPGPALGADTARVLAALGYGADELAAFRDKGVI